MAYSFIGYNTKDERCREMSKENLVEENAAVDAATNEDDNTHVTSRKYKITVCVIAVLLAIAFM